MGTDPHPHHRAQGSNNGGGCLSGYTHIQRGEGTSRHRGWGGHFHTVMIFHDLPSLGGGGALGSAAADPPELMCHWSGVPSPKDHMCPPASRHLVPPPQPGNPIRIQSSQTQWHGIRTFWSLRRLSLTYPLPCLP